MRRPWWLVILLGGAMAAVAVAEGDELASNRRLLDRWRGDAAHYQRLRDDLKAFYALPAEEQDRIRRFDHDLHQGDVRRQTRLWGVLDRYVVWLDKLSDVDRQRVRAAGDEAARLRAIKEIRDRQWVDRLPEKVRDVVLKLPPEERAIRVARLREEDREQRRRWRPGSSGKGESNLRPSRLSEFTPEVRAYLESLSKRLNAEEKERLRQAEGKWPDLPKLVRDLADLHPVLPPLPSGPITQVIELPAEVRKSLASVEKRKVKALHRPALARWPDFALEVTKLLRSEKLPAPPLGASRLAEFPADVQAVVKERLLQQLGGQKEALTKLEGHWPDYPRLLLRLARDRGVVLPGLSLPGPQEVWDNALVALPDVPNHLLMQFALHETSAEDRAKWELNTADPMGSLQKVKKEWYRKRLADEDRRRRGKKAIAPEPE